MFQKAKDFAFSLPGRFASTVAAAPATFAVGVACGYFGRSFISAGFALARGFLHL